MIKGRRLQEGGTGSQLAEQRGAVGRASFFERDDFLGRLIGRGGVQGGIRDELNCAAVRGNQGEDACGDHLGNADAEMLWEGGMIAVTRAAEQVQACVCVDVWREGDGGLLTVAREETVRETALRAAGNREMSRVPIGAQFVNEGNAV